jgi:hypothetical protein
MRALVNGTRPMGCFDRKNPIKSSLDVLGNYQHPSK